MNPKRLEAPGCPERRVTNYARVDGGLVLTLSCGHRQWVAGEAAFRVQGGEMYRPCLEGPCYKHQKFMGRIV